MRPQKMIQLRVDLSDAEAWDLAQFLKRANWHEYRSCAANDEEAYRMRDALNKVERSLNENGYAPR